MSEPLPNLPAPQALIKVVDPPNDWYYAWIDWPSVLTTGQAKWLKESEAEEAFARERTR